MSIKPSVLESTVTGDSKQSTPICPNASRNGSTANTPPAPKRSPKSAIAQRVQAAKPIPRKPLPAALPPPEDPHEWIGRRVEGVVPFHVPLVAVQRQALETLAEVHGREVESLIATAVILFLNGAKENGDDESWMAWMNEECERIERNESPTWHASSLDCFASGALNAAARAAGIPVEGLVASIASHTAHAWSKNWPSLDADLKDAREFLRNENGVI
jgi:hypothetical protein